MVTSGVTARQSIDWSSAIWSGIIAGAVFMMLEMVMVPLFVGGSPWGPPRMIAAIGMGRGVLAPPDSFALVPMMVAMAICARLFRCVRGLITMQRQAGRRAARIDSD
ncbi:hypothetical protein [Polaromonas sp.]|uniref:hypothetical protein n=1 Tax=Polaromonas sp. TaxID=1869339 RepID=UPI0025E58E0B|nr:hypothetical protein [Polaromonas sp.]